MALSFYQHLISLIFEQQATHKQTINILSASAKFIMMIIFVKKKPQNDRLLHFSGHRNGCLKYSLLISFK